MATLQSSWKIIVLFIALAAMVGGVFVYASNHGADIGPFDVYDNERRGVEGTVVADIEPGDRAALEAAAAFGPATSSRGGAQVPLLFNSGSPYSEALSHLADSEPMAVGEMGDTRDEISAAIASDFWVKTGTIVVVEDYERALQAAPLASLLEAPILFDGPAVDDFISDHDVLSAVTVGDVAQLHLPVKELKSAWDVYNYQFELSERKDRKIDYLMVVNPHDTDDSDPRLDIPGLSLAGVPLACHRNALVITGDFTVNVSWCQSLGYGLSEAGAGERGADEDETSDEDEIDLMTWVNEKAVAVDNAIDEAVKYLVDKGAPRPKYVCIVGGIGAIPHLYLKSPIWYEDVQQDEKGEEYLATDHYYGDLDVILGPDNDITNNYGHTRDELYDQELAVGRLVGMDLRDTSALAARSIFYWDLEFGRMDRVDRTKAVIVESLACGTADTGASTNQHAMFISNKMVGTKVYRPYATSAGEGVAPGDTKGVILTQMERSNGIIYDGHGYPDGWYYTWTSTHDNEVDYDRIGFDDVNNLNLKSCPVFAGACLTSALDWPKVWATSDNAQDPFTPDQFLSLAFIHAGAICYIGSTEESWGSFFGALLDENPDRWGYGAFDLATMFWENIFDGDTLGQALAGAKERFYGLEWTSPDGRPFARVCTLECVYYGDPAAENGNPVNEGLL